MIVKLERQHSFNRSENSAKLIFAEIQKKYKEIENYMELANREIER